MAIAYVGEVGKNNATGSSTTLAVTVTTAPGAGHMVVARIMGTAAISSVTDTKGNTWTIDKASSSSPLAGLAHTMQDVGTLTGTDTVTVTYGAGSNPRAMILDEFSGIAASPVDQVAAGTGTTTSRTAGTTPTTLQANEVVIACFALAANETSLTPGTGYSNFTSSFLGPVSGEYQIVSATGAYNPTATGGTSGTSHGVAVTYEASAAAPVNTVAPAVTGTTVVGQILSTTDGTWTG